MRFGLFPSGCATLWQGKCGAKLSKNTISYPSECAFLFTGHSYACYRLLTGFQRFKSYFSESLVDYLIFQWENEHLELPTLSSCWYHSWWGFIPFGILWCSLSFLVCSLVFFFNFENFWPLLIQMLLLLCSLFFYYSN